MVPSCTSSIILTVCLFFFARLLCFFVSLCRCSTPDSVWSAHGQFQKSGVAGCCARCCSSKKKSLVSPISTINNHHSPVKPDDYIRFRLRPAMNFYRSRIPTYARAHSFATLIMIVGSLAGGCLAFYDYAIWVGMLSSFTSAVVAWCEFSGTEKKLDRYSNIVISLKSINLWWDSLPEVRNPLFDHVLHDLTASHSHQFFYFIFYIY